MEKIGRITEADYIRARRRADRLAEIEAHGKQVSFRHTLHGSRKAYDRKKMKPIQPEEYETI